MLGTPLPCLQLLLAVGTALVGIGNLVLNIVNLVLILRLLPSLRLIPVLVCEAARQLVSQSPESTCGAGVVALVRAA